MFDVCQELSFIWFQSHLQLQCWITTTWIISRFILPTLIPFLSSISNCLLDILLTSMGMQCIRDCSKHITNITSLDSQNNATETVEDSQDADNVLYMTFHKGILIIKGAVLIHILQQSYFKISIA